MAPTATLKPLARAVVGTQSDARLVVLTRGGSEDAFAEIVRRHRPGLLRFARSLGSGERSEDVVQDGLVRAWRALRASDAEIDLRPWLTTIVRNRALSAHASARHHEQLDEMIDGVRQPSDIALLHEELRSAVSAVNSLPEGQRRALVLSALQGESHERIAEELETTPGAVRQLIFRARTGLRDGLGALVPLPAVRGLLELTGQGTAAGGAAGGSVAAIAGGGGGSIALKAITVVAVGAAVAGSGIAIQRDRSDVEKPAPAKQSAASSPASDAVTTAAADPATAGASAAPVKTTSTAAAGSTTPPGAATTGSASVSGAQAQTGQQTVPAGGGAPPADQAGTGTRDGGPAPTGAPQQQTANPPPPAPPQDHHGGGQTAPTGPQTVQPPPPAGQFQQPYDGHQMQPSGVDLDVSEDGQLGELGSDTPRHR
ncbi:MAG: hypothetical protein QOI10_2639 [Solirubrobacterales bacterium]|nr:hypothetical protein [Solirubrobacterales bacterium]